MINDLGKKIHDNAVSKGFWDNPRNLGEILMLIVSEVSEALEADRIDFSCKASINEVIDIPGTWHFVQVFREKVKNTFEDELADICIRVFDLAHSRGIDLEAHIEAKMRYNATREPMHGKKY